jgi:ribokinase
MDNDILVIGDANPDLLLRGDIRPRFGQAEQTLTAADLVLGGSAAITAAGCARLGLRTALLAALGDDVFGQVIRAQLDAYGVALTPAPRSGAPTGLSVILSAPDDRAILTLPGAIPSLKPGDVTDELLRTARHVHVSSLYLQPALAEGLADVFARARRHGITTSLDTNFDPTGRWAPIGEILAHTDVFLPNAAELAAITGAADGTALAGRGTTVVMKDGAKGARAWWPGGETAVAGLDVAVVDATGAGDSFNAGFLAAHLAGRPVEDALRWAAAAGSLSTRAAGGTAAQATAEEIRAAV